MSGGLGYEWRLRQRMAERGLFSAADLGPLLAARGVRLSDSQVWRLVTGTPERLNLRALMALCDILECTPNDLIAPAAEPARRPAARAAGRAAGREITPKPARVTRERRRPERG